MLIPIAINLLPSRATAFIREFDSPDNRNIGLVQVNLPNKQDDQQTRVWCLFHFEDIVDEFGEPAFKDTKISMKSLRERQVDLIARSIATWVCSSEEKHNCAITSQENLYIAAMTLLKGNRR